MTPEYIINRIPHTFQKSLTRDCFHCHTHYTELVDFSLQIEVVFVCGEKRYRVFYKGYNSLSDYIGEHTGQGYATIKEALHNLVNILRKGNSNGKR